MPRNGSGIYSKPAGTTAVPNTTIESSKFNQVIDDIAQDLNYPRPVSSGGTGGNTIASAQNGLSVDNKVVYASKSANYTAVATDNNGVLSFSASATLALTTAGTLGANWHVRVVASGGGVTIDPAGSETINGLTTIAVPVGYAADVICDGTSFFAYVVPMQGISTDYWWFQPIGVLIPLRHFIGVEIPQPPTDRGYRYILLSAGQSGAGGYNQGVLTSESVSGSSPLINASAVISLSGSPLNGLPVRLLNTERRFLRAGSPGAVQDSENLSHGHGVNDPGHRHNITADGSAGGGGMPRIDNQGISNTKTFNDSITSSTTGISINVSGTTESRPRNMGVDYYMRIL